MKYIILVAFSIFLFNACDTNENDFSTIRPFGAAKIENISISGNQVTVKTVYGTPTPCWYFYRNEITNNGNVFSSKVYGKDDGDMCVQMTGSFTREEKINFSTNGTKTLRFWQNDSTYLDTVIVIQ